MQKTALSFVACLLALAAAGTQASPLWKWRDASGQLHISDTAPPPGTPATSIISTPSGSAAAAPSPPPSASNAPELSALDKKKKAADQEKADKEKAEHDAAEARSAAVRKDNCERAQSALASLKTGQRIATVNANGERQIMDDAARAAETKHAQETVASNCGPAPSLAK